MTENMTFAELQQKMQIPKKSKGGVKYSFRNAEEIFTKFKQIGSNWIVITSDELEEVAGRIFIKATATARRDDEVYQAVGRAELATVPVFKGNIKQMQEPQWSGAVSSYARKYALQGLFGIGEEDVDGLEYAEQPMQQKQDAKISETDYEKVMREIQVLSQKSGKELKIVLVGVLKRYNLTDIKNLQQDRLDDMLQYLKKCIETFDKKDELSLENI